MVPTRTLKPTRTTPPRERRDECADKPEVRLDEREQSVYDALLPVLHRYAHFSADPLDFPMDSFERDVRGAITESLSLHRHRMVSEILLDFQFDEGISDEMREFVLSLKAEDLEITNTSWCDAVTESVLETVRGAIIADRLDLGMRSLVQDIKVRMWSIDSTTSFFTRVFSAIGRFISNVVGGAGRSKNTGAEDKDVVAAIWVSERDGKVCQRCMLLDGEIVGTRGDTLISPGLHPYCRCRLRYRMMKKSDYNKQRKLTRGDIQNIAESLRGGY